MTTRLRLPGTNAWSGKTAQSDAPASTAWLGATGLVASALLRLSFSSREGSSHFYLLATGLTGTLTAGALGAGPVQWCAEEWRDRPASAARDQVGVPALVGAATFAGFYGAARIVRRHPALRRRDVVEARSGEPFEHARLHGAAGDEAQHTEVQLPLLHQSP